MATERTTTAEDDELIIESERAEEESRCAF